MYGSEYRIVAGIKQPCYLPRPVMRGLKRITAALFSRHGYRDHPPDYSGSKRRDSSAATGIEVELSRNDNLHWTYLKLSG